MQEVWVFDVDGTIVDSHTGCSLRPGTIELFADLRADGCSIVLWSAGGASYAQGRATQHGIDHLVDGFYEKAVRDDDGRYRPAFLADLAAATFVDDRPEDMPEAATVVAVSPYLAEDPFDRGLTRAVDGLR
ncbi:MAG TPA: HAD family hydrolase [Acidimicrobiales bacterium]|jgi:phosphoglycolate phosphatase-like HAD superfamily hydrolase|nr:HAD family hydrolase [Acidimicrobiales bacterium]